MSARSRVNTNANISRNTVIGAVGLDLDIASELGGSTS